MSTSEIEIEKQALQFQIVHFTQNIAICDREIQDHYSLIEDLDIKKKLRKKMDRFHATLLGIIILSIFSFQRIVVDFYDL